MNWPNAFILASYIFQIVLIVFFPVPSAGSTLEMLFKVKKDRGLQIRHPAKSIVKSVPKLMIMMLATVTVTSTAFIPLVAIIHPPVISYLLPFTKVPSNIMIVMSVLLQITGNTMTLIAVRTLRSHVAFHPFGETTKLHISGIYGYLRNPITVGLTMIFSGFLLALPCGVLLAGFLVFLVNSNFRIKMEEEYLLATFGEEYCRYQSRVGKYFPRIFRLQKRSQICIR